MTYVENYMDLYEKVKQDLKSSYSGKSSRQPVSSIIPDTKNRNHFKTDKGHLDYFLTKGIAHDINNMASVIKGYLEIIKDNPKSDHIDSYLERTLEAVDMLLELNKLHAGNHSSISDKKSMGRVISEIEHMVDVIIGARSDISFQIKADPDVRLFKVNASHFNRIIQNLVKNAVDAMPKGGTLSMRFENELFPEDSYSGQRPVQYVKIVIEDEGVGIEENRLSNLFHSGYTSKVNGNGIGLQITRHLVHYNKGHIKVTSKPGAGTVFTLRFLPVY